MFDTYPRKPRPVTLLTLTGMALVACSGSSQEANDEEQNPVIATVTTEFKAPLPARTIETQTTYYFQDGTAYREYIMHDGSLKSANLTCNEAGELLQERFGLYGPLGSDLIEDSEPCEDGFLAPNEDELIGSLY